MKLTKYYTLILGSALMLAGGSAVAAIKGSLHDFNSFDGGANKTGFGVGGTGTTDTCVFCHTPHASAGNAVPLWNKALTGVPTAANQYTSTTIDGKTTFTDSSSMACLSCHDGTQAMDNMVNAPGTDGYTLAGASQAFDFTVRNQLNALGGNAIANLGTNLGDDHPVAIQFAGGGLTSAAPLVAANLGDPDFNMPLNNGGTTTAAKWWYDTGSTASKMDAGDIRLYTRNSLVSTTYEPFVECASCHDPHNGTAGQTFLRIANTGSAVCVACHNK